jgi:hypothetical protein
MMSRRSQPTGDGVPFRGLTAWLRERRRLKREAKWWADDLRYQHRPKREGFRQPVEPVEGYDKFGGPFRWWEEERSTDSQTPGSTGLEPTGEDE